MHLAAENESKTGTEEESEKATKPRGKTAQANVVDSSCKQGSKRIAREYYSET